MMKALLIDKDKFTKIIKVPEHASKISLPRLKTINVFSSAQDMDKTTLPGDDIRDFFIDRLIEVFNPDTLEFEKMAVYIER